VQPAWLPMPDKSKKEATYEKNTFDTRPVWRWLSAFGSGNLLAQETGAMGDDRTETTGPTGNASDLR